MPGPPTAARGRAERRAARRPLSRERIVQAALDLVDTEGLDALTMRRLADELGSGPMSLYHHVSDREDLIDGVAELLASTIRAPDAADWEGYARALTREVYRVGHEHPKAFGPLVARPSTTTVPHLAGVIGGMLERFVAAGLDERDAVLATRTLVNYLIGAVLSDVVGRPELPGEAIDPGVEFEVGLDHVLRGIAASIGR